jgi:MFS family permease
VLAGGSIVAVPFAPNIGLLIVALCVFGIAAAFLGTAPAASVGDAAGGRGGTAVALFSMCSDIGAIIGPLVAGYLADRLSYPAAFAVGAALMLAAAGLSWRMPRVRIGAPTGTGHERAAAE